MRPLEDLQKWLQSVIMHPLGVRAGAASDEARAQIDVPPEQIEAVVPRSQQLSSFDRLAVYGNAYYTRLLECLGDVFPITRQTLGDETFGQLALVYLQAHPSQSYTLGRLGARFAQFLRESRPSAESWSDFLIDLVQLEWTLDEVFDGPGIEQRPPLSHDELRAIPPAAWPQAELIAAPCLRLLSFRYPINDFFNRARHDAEAEIPAPANTYLAVTRRDYTIRRHPLSGEQHALLAALLAPLPVAAAIERLAEYYVAKSLPTTDAELAANLQAWFHEWTAAGFFAGVRRPG